MISTEKHKQKMKENYEKNREIILLKQKNYRLNNKEKIKIKGQKYYIKNKSKLSNINKAYYQEHKEELKIKNKERYAWNRFENVIKKREYYREHKEEVCKRMREFAKNNNDFMNEKRKKHELKYPEKKRARSLAKENIEIPENQICVMCNEKKATDRHHEDYSKPLEVKFVCHQCNCKLERIEIKC